MAGIGFLLRILSKQNNLLGLTQAYVTSALASTGPWLFTVIALGSIMVMGSDIVSNTSLQTFRVIIIYNFSFSLVMSGPVCMIATRYLADAIHRKDVSTIPGMMLWALFLLYITQAPIAVIFYLYFTQLSYDMAVMAIVNFLLISTVWLTNVFIVALKHYTAVTWAFMVGMGTAILIAFLSLQSYGLMGMLVGFSIGMGVIVAILTARIFTEYPYAFRQPVKFFQYFTKYWEIAVGGFVYNAAIWVDKWIMWFAPEAEKVAAGMVINPHYDSAMFLSYLTIIPSMAMFLFSIETNFFEHYLRFYRDIQNRATFRKIQRNHFEMIASIFSSSGNFLILQGSICLLAILLAPKILAMIGSSYQQIGIFRYGVLGALFHALTIFLLMLLSYFDNRKATFAIQLLFLAANGLFTWGTLYIGFNSYGYGYFLASLLAFTVTAAVTARYLMKLPYHSFITTNKSVL